MITSNDEDFQLGREYLKNQQHTAILINLKTTTTQVIGHLSNDHVSLFANISQHIFQSLTLTASATPHTTLRHTSRRQLVEATCEFLLKNLERQHTLVSISHAMHTNKNNLSQAFKAELKIGVSAWLRGKRMTKAKELLLTTALNIQEISALVGYSDQANFSTTFKKYYRISPLKMRQLHKV